MTIESQATYLSGDSAGTELGSDERAVLDRVRRQLASEAMWFAEPDLRSRLLDAAAAEPAPASEALESQNVPVQLDQERRTRRQRNERQDEAAIRPISANRQVPNRRRSSRSRAGAVALAIAAAAAIGFVTADRLTGPDGPATVATYELAATPLDPDASAAIDIRPTVAGVEIELRRIGLDNATGEDYYSAWLMSEAESVPIGSFHWRQGGVPVILWSGVDDPSYNRFVITRQRQGDGGVRSDQVVMMGDVPSLTASPSE